MFNVVAYLESRSIPYSTTGKNVSTGWIGLNCPYCDDTSDHLGVSLTTGLHSCWKCEAKGGPQKLVMLLEPCSYRTAEEIVLRYSDGAVSPIRKPEIVRPSVDSFSLPKPYTEDLPRLHRDYLIHRGFEPRQLQHDYGIVACHNIGRYRFRIIVPIYYRGELVNFVARDVTGNFNRRYLMPPSNQVPVPRDQLLYDIDRAGSSVILVEGVFDAWRIGRGAVATFGTRVTEEQCTILLQKKVKRLFIMFDSDAALNEGNKLAKKLSYSIPHVENLVIPEGDPDTYFLNNPDDLKEVQFLVR